MAGRSDHDFEADRRFEVEVLRVARLLYPGTDGGSTVLAGHERDGVLIGRDVAVAIEATRSRRQDKAEKDSKKLKQVTEALAKAHPTKAVRGFLITADEPTADQRDTSKKHGGAYVSAISFADFSAQLFDAASYLSARTDYPFGSARDPRTNKHKFDGGYIKLDLLELPKSNTWPTDQVASGLQDGKTFVLTGDYGIGKSMTLRELWRELSANYGRNPVSRVPVHLNLRDHAGQEEPAEALHRHATRIGFGDPAQLVRAWRSGLVALLLDGFDEITFPGWAGRVSGMADVRRRNVALLRAFVRDSPAGTGIILAGRSHFFDSNEEMTRAFNLPAGHVRLSASDFSAKQIRDYLTANGLEAAIPAWMPTRPLLVGYLAVQGLLTGGETDNEDSPAAGWHMLLDRVCEREAYIEVGLDGTLIRRIIERLASRARRTSSGRGPLRFDDLTDAFREVCGYQADEGSRVVLDRLPGLGVTGEDSLDEGLPREFVDADLADAARAGDVYAYICSPRVPGIAGGDQSDWDYLLEELGVDVVLHRMRLAGQDAEAASAALQMAVKEQRAPALTGELLRVVLAAGGSVFAPAPSLTDLILPTITIAAGADAGTAALRDCLITRLELEEGYRADGVPRFTGCIFQEVDGATAETDLPASQFEDCSFEAFADSASNTAAILELNLSDGARVLLTVLKKIYTQRGRGRKTNALSRGLNPALRPLVPDVLTRLQSENLILMAKAGNEVIWLPVKASQKRALQMLGAPMSSDDPLLRP